MKKTSEQTAQQGDVLLRKLKSMPSGTQTIMAKSKLTVAEGEQTGHSHVIEDEDAELIRVGERMLLKLPKPATITHEEHKPITLSPGIWEVGRVQEYDWFAQMQRQVID